MVESGADPGFPPPRKGGCNNYFKRNRKKQMFLYICVRKEYQIKGKGVNRLPQTPPLHNPPVDLCSSNNENGREGECIAPITMTSKQNGGRGTSTAEETLILMDMYFLIPFVMKGL